MKDKKIQNNNNGAQHMGPRHTCSSPVNLSPKQRRELLVAPSSLASHFLPRSANAGSEDGYDDDVSTRPPTHVFPSPCKPAVTVRDDAHAAVRRHPTRDGHSSCPSQSITRKRLPTLPIIRYISRRRTAFATHSLTLSTARKHGSTSSEFIRPYPLLPLLSPPQCACT